MRKGGLEVEGYLFNLCRGGLSVRGSFYRGGTRPYGATTEDVVVSHLSGRDGWDGFSQTGIVNINVHVPNLGDSPYSIKDVARCEALEVQLLRLIENHKTGDYLLTTEASAETYPEGDREHLVTLRVRYKHNRVND